VPRRVQNETLEHRGRNRDPLFGIRKLLLRADEHLDERAGDKILAGLRVGDPYDEVLGAWSAKESARSVYLVDDPTRPPCPLDIAIEACANDDVPEIRTVARTMLRWREEILNHYRTAASN
jgi:transposase